METKFYLQDVEQAIGLNGQTHIVKDVLFFHLKRCMGGQDAKTHTTEIDLKATKEHVKQYHHSYSQFKKANPSYVLPWPELDVVVEEPKLEAAVVVVEEKPLEIEQEVAEVMQEAASCELDGVEEPEAVEVEKVVKKSKSKKAE